MRTTKTFLAIAFGTLFSGVATAQDVIQKDTVPSTKEVKNRNVMLNASDANQPREISIGLPSSLGTMIFEDGLPVSYCLWPCFPFKSWRGGANDGNFSLMSLSETALRYGSVGYTVDSYSREGGDKFLGLLNYTVDHFGKQTFDLNLSGPIKKGWAYSFGTYQNFDPGTNDIKYSDWQDRTQIYRLGLTKRWNDNRGKVSLFYKYAQNHQQGDSYAPFYYDGDGSITSFDDFDLGKDSYIPADGILEYKDVKTGDMVSSIMKDHSEDQVHEVNFLFNYKFRNGMEFALRSKYKNADTEMITRVPTGIDDVTTDMGYAYEDGTPFSGKVQNRYLMHYKGFEEDWLTNMELTGKNGSHAWRVGLDEWWNRAGIATSTGNMAHEVKADPKSLLLNGQRYWDFNNGAEYYDGHENKLALYISDDWNISSRIWLSAGIRLEYLHIGGDAAFNLDGQKNNDRVHDFSLANPSVTITPFSKDWLNPSATFNARYTILNGFGLLGEYVFNRQRPNLQDFGGCNYPVTDPVDVHMARAGIFYNNKWLQLVSQVSYISQSNYKSRTQFSKQINGSNETITEAINYNIATLGWTTDAVITPFKGFTFHGLFTLQNPQYKDFLINPVFSDGSNEKHDFSDKVVTGMSKVILELDPSYSIGDWRIWASFRYQSKQYINKTNSLYFDGRWETFGGIDYRLNKHVSLSANVINFLNQKGVSGSIGSADLVEDSTPYQNYLMAGEYIRPFTVEFSAHINF